MAGWMGARTAQAAAGRPPRRERRLELRALGGGGRAAWPKPGTPFCWPTITRSHGCRTSPTTWGTRWPCRVWRLAVTHEVIVFCGVHFMAETAKLLAPERTVLLPDLRAGCSLADTVNAGDVRRWREANPGGMVVAYVEHVGGGQGGVRHLLHLFQCRRGRRVAPSRRQDPLPAGHVPGPARGQEDWAANRHMDGRVPRPRRHIAGAAARNGCRPP